MKRTLEGQKSRDRKNKSALESKDELLTAKNEQIAKLELEMGKLQEFQQRVEREEKENEQLNRELSVAKNSGNERVEKLNAKIEELEQQIQKESKEKQRKIDKLEAELAEKDAALLNISKQVGTEFITSEVTEIDDVAPDEE